MQLMFQHSLVVLWLYNTIMEMGNAVRKMMCVLADEAGNYDGALVGR